MCFDDNNDLIDYSTLHFSDHSINKYVQVEFKLVMTIQFNK